MKIIIISSFIIFCLGCVPRHSEIHDHGKDAQLEKDFVETANTHLKTWEKATKPRLFIFMIDQETIMIERYIINSKDIDPFIKQYLKHHKKNTLGINLLINGKIENRFVTKLTEILTQKTNDIKYGLLKEYKGRLSKE